ncbi:hypothetical protein GCM10027170_03530 [Aliiglaciecola aliphaticivorans]
MSRVTAKNPLRWFVDKVKLSGISKVEILHTDDKSKTFVKLNRSKFENYVGSVVWGLILWFTSD